MPVTAIANVSPPETKPPPRCPFSAAEPHAEISGSLPQFHGVESPGKQPGVIAMLCCGIGKALAGVDLFKGHPAPNKIGFAELMCEWLQHRPSTYSLIADLLDRHGPVCHIGAPLDQPLILCGDRALAKEILSETDKGLEKAAFSKSEMTARSIRALAGGQNVLFASGEAWRSRRNIEQQSFHPQSISLPHIQEALRGAIDDFCADIFQRVSENPEKSLKIDIGEECSCLTIDSTLRSLFGVHLLRTKIRDEISPALQKVAKVSLRQLLNPFNDGVGFEHKVEDLPAPLRDAHTTLQNFADNLISDALNGKNTTDCLVTDVVEKFKSMGAEEIWRPIVRNELLTILFAAYEASSMLLTWTVRQLSRSVEHQDRLTAEIKSRFNGAFPQPDSLQEDTNYLDWTFLEATRLFSPAWLVSRTANRDTTLTVDGQDYFFPKDCEVFIPLLYINRGPFWEDTTGLPSTEFRPERWAPERLEAIGKNARNLHTLSFGHGPRSCLGAPFAKLAFKASLVRLLTLFEFKSPEEAPDLEIHPADIRVEIAAKTSKPAQALVTLRQESEVSN